MSNTSSLQCQAQNCSEQGDEGLSIPMYIGLNIVVSNTIIFSSGLICNLLVIVVVAAYKNMHTTISFYLVNLSAADLCVLLVCQPVAVLEYLNKERWLLGSAVCKLVPVLESAAQHASTLTILAITYERMGAVCSPLSVFTKKNRRSRKLIPIIWITAVTLSSPFAGIAETTNVNFIDGTFGTICHAPIDVIWKKYFIVGSILFFFLLILIMGLMNVKIIRTLVNSERFRRSSTTDSFPFGQSSFPTKSSSDGSGDRIPLRSQKSSFGITLPDDVVDPMRKRRAFASEKSRSTFSLVSGHRTQIKNLVFIVIYLLISYLPIRAFILWQIFTLKQASDIGVERYLNLIWAFRFLIYIHSASNPFIYSFTSAKFMRSLKRLFKCGKNTTATYRMSHHRF